MLHSVHGKEKVGLDNSIVRLKFASQEFGDEALWVLAECTDLPFEDKEFDTVLLTDILEHLVLEDATKTLAEGARVGKKLIVTFPKDTSYISPNIEHIWPCSKEAVEDLLKGYPYVMKSSTCDNFWLVIIEL